MENKGVCCNVEECCHNVNCCKCSLDMIEISCMKTGANSVEMPHYCKNYKKK